MYSLALPADVENFVPTIRLKWVKFVTWWWTQETHRFNDVWRVEGDVLYTRSPIIVHVFLWGGGVCRTVKILRQGVNHKLWQIWPKSLTLEALVHLLPDCTIVSNHIKSQRNGNVAVIKKNKLRKSHLDLRYPFPWCRFIDRHLDGLFIVGHHYGPQWTVIRVDLLVVYWPEAMEHQTSLIPEV